MGRWILGVDAGGSKTRALLAEEGGRVRGRGLSGPANPKAVGWEGALAAIWEAVRGALAEAGVEGQVEAACVGLAGADTPEERAAWAKRLGGLALRLQVVHDVELLLAAAFPEAWGVALVSGTGSVAFGRSPDGRTARVGGWGYLLGDEGSGFSLALQALRLALQTADGRAQAPSLLQAALEFWGLGEPEGLLGVVYGGGKPQALASFAPVVLKLAEAGDPAARPLVFQAGRELARQVGAVIRQLGLHRPPLALGGGLLRASPLLREAVYQEVGLLLGGMVLVEEPALGALALARRLLASSS